MSNSFDDFLERITDPDLNSKIVKIIKPKIEKYFEESVQNSIIDFYNSYAPIDYLRTGNFLNVLNTARTYAYGDTIEMQVSNTSMDVYPGWGNQSLAPDGSFNMFYMNGYHGYDSIDGLLRIVSNPPHLQVLKDVQNGFGGRVYKDIKDACNEIFK